MANDISISGSARGHAIALANKAGKELSDFIAGLIQKGEEVAAGPITTLQQLREVYGDEKLSEEFPRLDTEEGPDTNGYTEKYEAQEVVAGETKTRKANFFTDYWLTLDAGKAQAFQLEQIKFAQSKNDRDKAEEAFRQMDPVQLANLKKKLTNAKSKGRGYIRKAIGVWFVMVDLANGPTTAAGDPVCALEFAQGHEANTYPLDLVDATRKRMFRPMSVGDVLKLDVAAAIKAGGNLFDQLEKQLSRDTGDGAKTKVPSIDSVDKFADYAAALFNYLDYESESGAEHGTAIRERMAKKKGGEHLVMMVGRLRTEVNALWTPSLQVRYDKLINKQLEQGGDDDAPAQETAAA